MKIMASDPITSWEIDGETVETVTDFIVLGSKITEDGDYSHEIKRCLLLGRKVMNNPYSILKSRHYFANKGPFSQSYGFSSSHVWIPWGENGNPLQYSCLENPMDRETWQATIHGVRKSQTWFKLTNQATKPTNQVKAMVFPVVRYGCENWTIKKAEH